MHNCLFLRQLFVETPRIFIIKYVYFISVIQADTDNELILSFNITALGIEGRHQFQNASLAVQLCTTWLQRYRKGIFFATRCSYMIENYHRITLT